MNRIILLYIMCLLMASCHVPKTVVTESNDTIAMQMQSNTDAIESVKTFIDSTRIDKDVTKYTEIVFMPLDIACRDPTEITISENGINIHGGQVLSISQYTKQTESADIGVTETEFVEELVKADSININLDHKEQTQTHEENRYRNILSALFGVFLAFSLVFGNRYLEWAQKFIRWLVRLFK